MGIGFAIPINLAREIMEDLVYEGEVIRGWIGISVQDLTPEVRRRLGASITGGALVSEVIPGEPAAQAGIQQGDVIVSIDGERVSSASDLLNLVAAIRPGRQIPLTLIRGRERIEVTVRVSRRNSR